MNRLFAISIMLSSVGLIFSQSPTDVYSGNKANYIGMPVGGITAGQVYLGGDGQLWYWDIFNIQRIQPGGPGDKFYLNPMIPHNHFEQGFAIRLHNDEVPNITPTSKPLKSGGFSEIEFRGEYPIGKVSYDDSQFPVSVKLNAFSPFVPTDHESSDFPAVVLEYTLTNKSEDKLNTELIGWLQNMANYQTALNGNGYHLNEITSSNGNLQLQLSSQLTDGNVDYPDYGNMTLTLEDNSGAWGNPSVPREIAYNLSDLKSSKSTAEKKELGKILTGALGKKMVLDPGASRTVTFIISWYFPNLHREESGFHHLTNMENLRHYYSKKFTSSAEVANKILSDKEQFLGLTKLWNNTWYDSTLPIWFLDRTFINTSTLATTSCYRLDDLTDNPDNEGRFYTMEGVYLGHGTCTHVFHYEQALGRVFPSLARQLRTQVDFGLSYQDNGIIGYRGELSELGRHDGRGYAVDGHAGTILRAYREHTTADGMEYLSTHWARIKKSIEYMIAHDAEKSGAPDGVLEGAQYNTLDRIWYGKIAWTSSLYNAALRAGESMAVDVNDRRFAKKCASIAEKGKRNISEQLFNGEYFYQILDPEHLDAPNSNDGCHADQILGQYWAKQVGLPDAVEFDKSKTALSSIMKNNYFERYGDHLRNTSIPVSRYYALADEPGMIMCSFPKGGADLAPGKINSDWEKLVVGYFSEPWTGQEHQVAASMIDHGLVEEALKLEQAVHMRYNPAKRNPYNEIEYGNHYTRAMSGYAPFVSVTGFTLHEPRGEFGYAPKLTPNNFKSAFISGKAWGTISQKIEGDKQLNRVVVKYGSMELSKMKLEGLAKSITSSEVNLNGQKIHSKVIVNENHLTLSWKALDLSKEDNLEIKIEYKD